MPIENTSKQPLTAEKEPSTSDSIWNQSQGTTLGEQLREVHNTNVKMCKELEAFSLQGFQLVDSDKDGYVSGSELDTALKNPPAGVPSETLEFAKENIDFLEGVSRDEWSSNENNGISKRDIANFNKELQLIYDSKLARGIVNSLQREDLRDLESVVKAAHDRPNSYDKIAYQVEHYMMMPGITAKAEADNLRGAGAGKFEITQKYPGREAHKIALFTDQNTPAVAYKNSTWGAFSQGSWQEAPVPNTLKQFGDEEIFRRLNTHP